MQSYLTKLDQGAVFFFRGKVWRVLTHSLWAIFFFSGYAGKKKTSFFSEKIWQKSVCFFLPQKKFIRQSLTRFQRAEKIKQHRKKNSIFTHSLEKPQKGANFKLFRGKKIRYLCPGSFLFQVGFFPEKRLWELTFLFGAYQLQYKNSPIYILFR